jgi:hypothetical protein
VKFLAGRRIVPAMVKLLILFAQIKGRPGTVWGKIFDIGESNFAKVNLRQFQPNLGGRVRCESTRQKGKSARISSRWNT